MESNQAIFPINSYPYRVIYADTDAGGVVYYANYLRMFELARTLYIEDFGVSLTDLAQNNCFFAVRHVEVNYNKPAVLGDQLTLQVQITGLEKASIQIVYEILRQTEPLVEVLVEGSTRMACCTMKDNRPVPMRIPKWMMNCLRAGQQNENS